MTAPVAVLGGTFNPIHLGHLRSALELRELMGAQEVRLMPAAVPPHRELPSLSAELRSQMVELAVADEPGLVCDARELSRTGPSYTYDSLLEIRGEIGPEQPLVLVMGSDAPRGLAQWYRWQELPELAHLLILNRPGHLPDWPNEVADWLQARSCDTMADLVNSPAGKVLQVSLRALDISSTAIRNTLASGGSARYLVPDPVWNFIRDNALYTGDS